MSNFHGLREYIPTLRAPWTIHFSATESLCYLHVLGCSFPSTGTSTSTGIGLNLLFHEFSIFIEDASPRKSQCKWRDDWTRKSTT
jgi:hypothetical protein